MNKVISAEEAALLLKEGDTVVTAPSALTGWPEELGTAIRDRYIKTGQPKGITHVHAAGSGDWGKRGGGIWADDGCEGLVKRVITSHVGASPRMAKAVQEEKVECYFWPLGVMVQWYTQVARRAPGHLTKTGLYTFIDPRLEGGRVNSISKEEFIKVVQFEGEEWLLFKSFSLNVVLLRGTTADEKGNVTFGREAIGMENLPVAQAVKASGGIVIVQVENLAKAGTLHPQQVLLPGICVDYVVVAREPQMQTSGTQFDAALCGDIKVPEAAIPTLPLDERKIIARRAAMELKPGPVNLGLGIPQGIANVVAEEGCGDALTLISEVGNIGGIPAVGVDFGAHYNGEAMLRQDNHCVWMDGGGLAMAFIGLSQTDRQGNINVGKFGPMPTGPGGFINVTQHARKVVFCGSFTARSLEVEVVDGALRISKEGKARKFLNQVDQIAFNGQRAWKAGQEVIYVTERAVFKLLEDGLMLTEIAPSVDLDKDILAHMDFKPIISADLRQMRSGIFRPQWGELKEVLGA